MEAYKCFEKIIVTFGSLIDPWQPKQIPQTKDILQLLQILIWQGASPFQDFMQTPIKICEGATGSSRNIKKLCISYNFTLNALSYFYLTALGSCHLAAIDRSQLAK